MPDVPLTLAASLVSTGSHETVNWVPDEEVSQCPLCNSTFGMTLRKHHCRACGRVVCSSCSANKALVQNYGQERQRVCDDCYKVLCHDKEGSLAESQMQYRLEEASLKEILKERHEQKECFSSFLLNVNNRPVAAAATIANPSASSRTRTDSQHEDLEMARVSFLSAGSVSSYTSLPDEMEVPQLFADLEPPELGAQAQAAYQRWNEGCLERKVNQEHLQHLRADLNKSLEEVDEQKRKLSKLQDLVQNMERQKRDHPKDSLQKKRDHQQAKIDSLEEELKGLSKKKEDLEAQLPRVKNSWGSSASPTVSFLSVGRVEVNSFRGGHCVERMRNCTVM